MFGGPYGFFFLVFCLCPGVQRGAGGSVTVLVSFGPHSRVWLRYGDGTRGCAILPAGAVHEHRPGADVVVAWHPEHQAVVPDAGLAGSVAS
ncbi:TOBE domain-containing protein [Amycolatopsis sp. NPDC058986]|uniref:TOBE domain-containing protein n=1 Tax=Amycolatopsis sp. NPDC058986 TaxID=3346685 RepID=UPI0036718A9D